jgi:ATP-dependent RNA helicase RhlE
MQFDTLGLRPEILRAVKVRGYKTATPIQAQAIPAILDGRDVRGGAQTGTGKTAAFALPILDILSDTASSRKKPRALILAPTRELADQVGESFMQYGKYLKLRTVKIFGGVKINPQIARLRDGVDIVIATPGRLMDHLNQKTIDLSFVKILVLDEADRMLDMGFIRDIRKIIGYLPPKRQNLMFSATYGSDIKALAGDILKNPVNMEVTKRNTAAENVRQLVHYVEQNQKRHFLAHLINKGSWYQVLVFVRTKHGANRLASQLRKDGILTGAIHGDKSQSARTTALKQFKKGDIQVLIATDVASRGLHLDDLSHVVNYDLPAAPEDYIHRIGRTGRAGKDGTAISLVSSLEKKHLQRIQKLLKAPIPVEIVEDFIPIRIVSNNGNISDNKPNNRVPNGEKAYGTALVNNKPSTRRNKSTFRHGKHKSYGPRRQGNKSGR